MKLNIIKINIPLNFNFIILKKINLTNLIIYDNNFKFKIFIKNIKKLKINKNLNFIEYNSKKIFYKNYFLKNIIYSQLEKINNYYFNKIKFKGKGYKIGFYKKKFINFFFGKSHKSLFLYKNIFLKKLSKYKFIILKNNKNKLNFISLKIIKIKFNNEYTNRGLRKTRQIIIKRKGNKGSF